ncbi:MAG TPA: HlyD family efflux transporter periplasmic adaptor subunit [Armatimonadota bacterium]|nr:HlyD family efflux transporter periplasmic adaptor subunit [Armatimonadota bacterium]
MNPRVIIVPVLVMALLIGGYFIDRSRAQRESLLSGYFESQPTRVSSRLGGRVERILVKEGDVVKAGQTLLELEANSANAGYRGQLQAVEQARQQYLETARGTRREEITRQNEALRAAQANLDLLINGPLPEQIAASRFQLEQTGALYQKALAGSRPEEIASAKAAAAQAFEKYRQAQRGLTNEERAQLKARLDGALANEDFAKKQLDRSTKLFDQGAIAKQDLDRDKSAYDGAVAARRDAQQAYQSAEAGTPPEELAQARDAYKQAEAQLSLVLNGSRKEDIDAARDAMLSARANFQLLLKGSRPEDIRAARATRDGAKALLIELQRGNRPEDIAKARSAVREAALQARSALDNLKERIVCAPNPGIVERILVADGDLVAVGAPVIQEDNPDDIWLRVYLPEAQLAKVRVDDSAELAIDGIPGNVRGVVESIAAHGEFTPANLQSPDERAKQEFAIRIRLAQPDARVKAGMYATVRSVGRWP